MHINFRIVLHMALSYVKTHDILYKRLYYSPRSYKLQYTGPLT